MGIQGPQGQLLQLFNAQEPRKKDLAAKIGRPILAADVIYTNFNQQFEKI
jgi:hypothetical protein